MLILGKDNMRLLSDFFNFLEVLSSLWKLKNFSVTFESIK